ncbi:MAG: STAS domain-containing protein [Planctomycetota bacterium]
MVTFAIDTSTPAVGARTLRVRGSIDAASFEELEAVLRHAFAESMDTVTVDLGNVDFVSSVGVVVLLDAVLRANEEGIDFTLARVPDHVLSVLDLLSLVERFRTLCHLEPLADQPDG